MSQTNAPNTAHDLITVLRSFNSGPRVFHHLTPLNVLKNLPRPHGRPMHATEVAPRAARNTQQLLSLSNA